MIRKGASRVVFLIGPWAIKVPRLTQPHRSIGRYANRDEQHLWATDNRRSLMCPVLFADRWGWVVIMPRCTEVSRNDYEAWDDEHSFDIHVIGEDPSPFERGSKDVGRLPDGRIVFIDYGARAYSPPRAEVPHGG
jgi:hypothetical protein